MTLRYLIRAVPQRREWVNYLTSHLPSAEVIWDDQEREKVGAAGLGRWGCYGTFLKALRVAGGEPSVHMEDDIILTRDFTTKLLDVVNAHPKNLIQFFSMRKADPVKGSRWDGNFLMAQCFYLPAFYSLHLASFLEIWHAQNPQHIGGTDFGIGVWLKKRREKYWLHVPSLVQHRVGPSVSDYRRAHHRQSLTFVDPDE